MMIFRQAHGKRVNESDEKTRSQFLRLVVSSAARRFHLHLLPLLLARPFEATGLFSQECEHMRLGYFYFPSLPQEEA